MTEGQPHRVLYITAVPILSFGLCVLSYYWGYQRGLQEKLPSSQAAAPQTLVLGDHEEGGNLTFFKNLREKEEREVNPGPPAPAGVGDIRAYPNKGLPEVLPAAPVAGGSEEARSGFAVQVSAFKDVGKAHELTDNLKNRGYPAFAMSGATKGLGWHKVYVGPFEDKPRAESQAAVLAKDGFGGGFVTRLDAR